MICNVVRGLEGEGRWSFESAALLRLDLFCPFAFSFLQSVLTISLVVANARLNAAQRLLETSGFSKSDWRISGEIDPILQPIVEIC